MRLSGTLSQWNDARGFGFIAGADGERYFVHISAIDRIATRPRDGDAVTFVAGRGPDGRPAAKSVKIDGANPFDREVLRRGAPPVARPRPGWRAVVAGLFALLLAVAVFRVTASLWLVGIYAVMSVVSFALYGSDKAAAEAKRWRTSEARLLAADLFCGVIGGLLAQEAFRHKTRKPTFIFATAIVGSVHALWLTGLATGLISAEEMLSLARSLFGAA